MSNAWGSSAFPDCSNYDQYSGNQGYDNGFDYDENGQVVVGPPCESANTNIRGHYVALHFPCSFTFHKSTDPEDEEAFSTSTLCSNENRLDVSSHGTHEVLEYVKGWGDQCVGDFARCYSLANDESIYLSFVCQKKWTFPSGATHMSVNCTADKAAKLANTGDANDQEFKFMELQRKQNLQQDIAMITGFSIIMLCLAGGSVGVVYVVIRQNALVRSTSTSLEEREELNPRPMMTMSDGMEIS
jgi:hypothetical protein